MKTKEVTKIEWISKLERRLTKLERESYLVVMRTTIMMMIVEVAGGGN